MPYESELMPFHSYPALGIEGRAPNLVRGRAIRDAAQVAGHTCLDVGCNEGFYSHLLRDLGAQSVLAIDRSEKAIGIARERQEQTKLTNVAFVHADYWTHDCPSFDTVFASEVLVHEERCVAFLQRLRSLCSKQLILMTGSFPDERPLSLRYKTPWGWDSIPSTGWLRQIPKDLGFKIRKFDPDAHLFIYVC